MFIRSLASFLVLFFGLNAFAIDPAKCPASFELTVAVSKVYKTSIYSKVPGWKAAQQALLESDPLDASFRLSSTKPESCLYQGPTGVTATLSTAKFNDPEEPDPVPVDQLTLSLALRGSTFVSFLPLDSYDANGLKLYSNPFPVKVKARLFNPDTNRWASYDMGMIAVSMQ
ncbi:MAG: hypothetical protein IT288_14770 [Bdellovibrionales bacterium]|nr:hypothetical protein [Bdellovibrionales bacterium]